MAQQPTANINNVLEHGVFAPIDTLLDGEHYSGAVMIIFAGIDAMAWLGAPEDQQAVTRKDFVGWADRYVSFPCEEQLTGWDLYGARCAVLHQFGTVSDLSSKGKCRMVGYMNTSNLAVRFDPNIDPAFVLVSVSALAQAFVEGASRYVLELFSDPARAAVANKRLGMMHHLIPVDHG